MTAGSVPQALALSASRFYTKRTNRNLSYEQGLLLEEILELLPKVHDKPMAEFINKHLGIRKRPSAQKDSNQVTYEVAEHAPDYIRQMLEIRNHFRILSNRIPGKVGLELSAEAALHWVETYHLFRLLHWMTVEEFAVFYFESSLQLSNNLPSSMFIGSTFAPESGFLARTLQKATLYANPVQISKNGRFRMLVQRFIDILSEAAQLTHMHFNLMTLKADAAVSLSIANREVLVALATYLNLYELSISQSLTEGQVKYERGDLLFKILIQSDLLKDFKTLPINQKALMAQIHLLAQTYVRTNLDPNSFEEPDQSESWKDD